jgi:hypothetical protein
VIGPVVAVACIGSIPDCNEIEEADHNKCQEKQRGLHHASSSESPPPPQSRLPIIWATCPGAGPIRHGTSFRNPLPDRTGARHVRIDSPSQRGAPGASRRPESNHRVSRPGPEVTFPSTRFLPSVRLPTSVQRRGVQECETAVRVAYSRMRDRWLPPACDTVCPLIDVR